jgi:FtsP/CotA-like multicopper oxidase with cupredoxin domain
MDGTPSAQDPVPPGGTFDYRFELPDAGLFWYHPHVSSSMQLSRGLYGALLVDDPEPPGRGFGPEVVLMLSDAAIAPDGSPIDDSTSGGFGDVFGREGNVLLVNGRINPELLARRGERQRWRVVNAARSRFYRFSMPGAHFTRVGGDGGLAQSAVDSDDVMIVPGERADLLVTPDAPVGTELQARWLPYDRGYGTDATLAPQDLLRVRIAEDRSEPPPAPLPAVLRTVPPLDLSSAVAQSVVLGDGPQGSGEFTVNGAPFGGGDNGPGTLHANVGETDVFTVDNQTGFDHPFHLHGFFFQVLDPTTNTPRAPAEWKDTVNVPQMSTVKFAVTYDDRPGMWMFHCHILDHAEAGMMGMLHLHP